MRELTPEQIEQINASRDETRQKLRNEGAIENESNLEITDRQYRQAWNEMWTTDLSKRPEINFDGNSEVLETRTFNPREIIKLIAEIEHVSPEDIFLKHQITDSQGNILEMQLKLKDEIAAMKFGKFVDYSFEIKGRFTNKKERPGQDVSSWVVPATVIEKFSYSSEMDEKDDVTYESKSRLAEFINNDWVR